MTYLRHLKKQAGNECLFVFWCCFCRPLNSTFKKNDIQVSHINHIMDLFHVIHSPNSVKYIYSIYDMSYVYMHITLHYVTLHYVTLHYITLLRGSMGIQTLRGATVHSPPEK